MTQSQERRTAPRIVHEVPVTIRHPEGEFVVQTKNLSTSGAYCVFKRFVPPMTKLEIHLQIPANPHAKSIACQGVVVRVDPPHADPNRRHYDVAIFFSDIQPAERASLTAYIQQHLQPTSSRG